MNIRIRAGLTQFAWGMSVLLCLTANINLASPAESIDILRSTPMEVNGYASAKAFPETFTTQDQVIQALNSTPVLLVHMEALRRAYHDLAPGEHDKLLEAIHKRRLTNEKDLMLGFDHGYAQMVFKQNKTGLFFLRKANDYFKDQFSALAYAMAQVEADINLENSTPEITTTRKMDATFKLGDAVIRDAMNHQPGFWPSYIQVIAKMKPMPAYKSFSHRDFSLTYVPYGDSVTSLQGVSTSSLPLSSADATTGSLTDVPLGNTCSPDEASPLETSSQPISGASVAQQSAIFNGKAALIQFFPSPEPKQYHVRVTGNDGQPMATFTANTIPRRIVEDLDKDGVYEVVVRQYAENPLMPVIVYRYTPCGLERDQKIHESFQ
ncbi:hypothetical protein [Vampirovibrio sp.]|uniref:hypothetical protein n=1 Tax=Vampirovibrio sp. TaxID=2717857 RepID=UPI0035930889